MAETAKILSPDKTVILPVSNATCPMANMISAEELRGFKKEYPDAAVVCYVNTTADVKAESDICCTSSNAVKICESVEQERIIFVPDRNLAHYAAGKVDKEIIPWQGFCPVHDNILPEEVIAAKEKYPLAAVMAHPECRPEVLELADYAASTGQMFDIAAADKRESFIVGTEEGMIYPLKKKFPEKNFFPVRSNVVCPNMKKNNLDRVIEAMETLTPEIKMESEIIEKASLSLKRMLDVS